jgi:hypothetical protein
MTVRMSTDETEETTGDLGEGSPRGGEGLTGYAIPSSESEAPDPDETVQATARGGEGLAKGYSVPPASDEGPDPDETVQDTIRGGEGLADGAA